MDTREKVDAGCRKLTSSWVRQEHKGQDSGKLCSFFENIEDLAGELQIPSDVYTLSD